VRPADAHWAHPLGVKGFAHPGGVKNDVHDAADQADLLRMLSWQGDLSFGPPRDGQRTVQRLDTNPRWRHPGPRRGGGLQPDRVHETELTAPRLLERCPGTHEAV